MNAKNGKRTYLNVFYNIFTIEIYMKFILPCPQLKLYSKIHNTILPKIPPLSAQRSVRCVAQ